VSGRFSFELPIWSKTGYVSCSSGNTAAKSHSPVNAIVRVKPVLRHEMLGPLCRRRDLSSEEVPGSTGTVGWTEVQPTFQSSNYGRSVGTLPCVDPLVNAGDHHRCGHHDRRPDFTSVVDDHQPLFDHDAGSRLKQNDACTVGVHFIRAEAL